MKYRTLPGAAAFLLMVGLAGSEALATSSRTNEPQVRIMPRFEIWPAVPKRTNVPPPAVAPPAPKPVLAPEAARKKLYSFRAENLEIKSALAVFARANNLNIVPDQDAIGQVTLDVTDLSLDKMMQALLEANDLSWTEEDGLIRVRAAQSRNFVVDYLRLVRSGQGSSAVTLSSGGLSSGGSGSSGGGGGGGATGGGAGGSSGSGGNVSSSQMNLKLDNQVEFWNELQDEITRLLTTTGKQSLAINRTAGIIQITDRPSALHRVGSYLDQLRDAVSRQVDIEAKLYDVTLGDQFQFGIDWQRVAAYHGGNFQGLASPFGDPSQLNLTRSSFLRPGGGVAMQPSAITLLFSNRNTTAVIQALREQGEVSVISQPRLRALNNQTAIMKVGTDQPFFTQKSSTVTSAGGINQESGDQVSIITVGTVLSITPQISSNGMITLDITPAITSFVEEKRSPTGLSSAPVLDIKQTSTIVRLHDDETIVIGGLIQKSSAKSVRKIPVLGDIPFLGKLFQGRVDAKQRKELIIFLTPRVVE